MQHLTKGFITFISLIALSFYCTYISAQKLPYIQKAGILAPDNVKVDGKADEWNNQLQAYNKNTEIYYTIANDDDNLYLVIQAKNPQMIQKTVMAGISFVVYHSKSKKEKQPVMVTFPVMNREPYQRILRPAIGRYDMKGYIERKPIKDTAWKKRFLDTVMRRSNAQIDINMKLIGIAGIESVEDSVISVFNDTGIKAAARFDNKMVLTYEFALPLKYLNFSTDKPSPFGYHIILNGGDDKYIYTGTLALPINQDIVGMTELWGEYTLLKKN